MSPIAVVIPTRNRGAEPADAARAVLRDPVDLELVVVDQSTNDLTAEALRPLAEDPRLRVIRSGLRGISNARNTGVTDTTAPILAFTDDDCRPEQGWASSILRVFREDPDADFVFGRVRLPPNAPPGVGASFEPSERVLHGGVPLPGTDIGVGANFAVRRTALEKLGGFDALLGTGAPFFRAGEETDLVIRALYNGHRIVNASECEVLHLGARTGDDVRSLYVGYQLGTGAAFGKHARIAGLRGLRDAAHWAGFYFGEMVRDAARLRRPRPGVLVYFVAGAALTFRYRINGDRNVFERRS